MSEPPLPGPNRDPWPQALWDHPEPVIDTVENLGEDPYNISEGQDISSELDAAIGENVKVEIPAGTYDLDDPSVLAGSYQNLWVQGQATQIGDVELHSGSDTPRINIDSVGTDGVVIIENLDFRGVIVGGTRWWTIEASDESSELIFKRVRHPDGGEASSGNSPNCWYLSSTRDGNVNHLGCVRFLWCHSDGFGDNGAYADGPLSRLEHDGSEPYGQIIVVGGEYGNNNIGSVRLGTPYSTVYNTRVYSTEAADTHASENQRGIRFSQPEADEDTVTHFEFDHDFLVSGCDLEYDAGINGSPINESGSQTDASTGMIHDTRVRNDSSSTAVRVDSSRWSADGLHVSGDGNLDASGLTVEGSDPPDMEPWWGFDEDDGSPSTPTDNELWRRRYDTYVDNFEIGDLTAPYEAYFGSPTPTRDTDVTAPDSGGSMRWDGGDGLSHALWSMPGDGLYHYPSRSEDFEYWFRRTDSDDGTVARLFFFLEIEDGESDDDPSGYFVDHENDEVSLTRYDAGSVGPELASSQVSTVGNEWYRVVVSSTPDDISITTYTEGGTELTEISTDDASHSGSGVMYWAPSGLSEGSSVWFDEVDHLDVTPDELVDNFHTGDFAAYASESDIDPTRVVEDFEGYTDSADMRSDFSGNEDRYDLETTDAIVGSQAVVNTNGYGDDLRGEGDDHTTEVGHIYSTWLNAPTDNDRPWLCIETETDHISTPLYFVRIELDDHLRVGERDNDGHVDEETTPIDLNADTDYRVELEYWRDEVEEADKLQARVFDAGDTQLAETPVYTATQDLSQRSANDRFMYRSGDYAGLVFDHIEETSRNGEGEAFVLSTATASESIYSLEWPGAGVSGDWETLTSQPGSGEGDLDTYPDEADSISLAYYLDSENGGDSTGEYRWLVSETEDTHLGITFDFAGGGVSLYERDSGTDATLDSAVVAYPVDDWQRVDIEQDPQAGTVDVTVEDGEGGVTLSGSVSSLNFGNGIAWHGTGEDALYRFDENVAETHDIPESELDIVTESASNVGETSATLHGDLVTRGPYDEVDVYFQWRASGATEWASTPAQRVDSAGAFSETIDELSASTTYEFRAAADGVDSTD